MLLNEIQVTKNAIGHSDTGELKSCRICGAQLKYTFLDLGMCPLVNSYPTEYQLSRMEQFYPLHVSVCEVCLLVQLQAVVSPEEIFSDYLYLSSYSSTWLDHCRSYCDNVVRRFDLGVASRVIEIGSNDGYLLRHFTDNKIPVLGIEPAANVAAIAIKKGIPTVVKFFTCDTAAQLARDGIQGDLLVANNVLAHVPKLNDFVQGLKIALKPRGVITAEFPHLMRLMEENQFDTIYDEHLSYFSFITAQKVFAMHGLVVFDVEELPTHGGSLRIYVCHSEDLSKPISRRVQELILTEKAAGFARLETYLLFPEKVKEAKRRILEFLIGVKNIGKSVVAYGAPAKGNTLLNYCGIKSNLIEYTVDRNPYKQGRFLPGSHIPIHHPDKIRETMPAYLVILPWNVKTEVMKQMAYIRDWGGKFVVLIPKVRVY